MEPTIRQLQYLVAVAELSSFSRAAERCLVSQPALSTQIQQLERSLGVSMFERGSRHIQITPSGEAVVEHARRVLDALSAMQDVARSSSAPLTGTLRLGVIPTVAPYLLPRLMPGLRARYPGLRLLIREDQTSVLVRRLERGELDLLLLALEADLGDARTMKLFRDPFQFVASPDHPLAQRKSLKESDLEGAELMLLDDGHCLREQVLKVCRSAGALEENDFRASSLNTLLRMVESGLAATLIPKLAESTELNRGESVVLVPFDEPGPARTIGCAWRRASPRTAEFRLLAEVARAAAPQGCAVLR